MRKFFNTLVAVALAVAATASLSACDDDDPDDPEPPTKHVKEATVTTYLYVNQALADAYDIHGKTFLGSDITLSAAPAEVSFKGGKVPMYYMTVDGSGKALPVSAYMTVTFTLKDGYQLPEKSDFAIAAGANGKVSYTDGTFANFLASGYEIESNGVRADRIDSYTAYLNRNFGYLKATLEDDELDFDTEADD